MPDRIASVASFLGDHGLIWFLIGVARARRPGSRRKNALRALLYSGTVVPLVNSAMKASVARVRPERSESTGPYVRIPRTASFPSGHALAAWCSATLLSKGDPLAPVYYSVAAVISLSRIHLRLHHFTDVIGGAVGGLALGILGRKLTSSTKGSE